ncbi:MAG: hypothetical protein R3228_02240, partial [Halioglobus sp.]|nr:hypothetical protein [Halioglobus sp.]
MTCRTLVVAGWLLFLSAAGALAHDADKPNRHADRYQHYEGTKTCLECHEEEALTFFHSRHYQWRGGAPDPDEARAARDAELGKLTTINDFCTTPGYQWIGEVVNDKGKVLARGCSSCHSGLGKMPGTEPTRDQLENMDCLICHASGYRRNLYRDEQGEWEWRPILYENQEGLDIVSKRVTLPDRAICLRCHAASGGGPNFKRGDIEYILKEPDFEHDVHMAPRSEGGQDMWCIDCHTDDEHTHRMIGRGIDLAANDRPDRTLDCSGQCHQDFAHQDNADLDRHDRLTCPTCHIPSFARDEATDMFRDWSNVHFDEDKGKYMYDQELEYDVEPVYAWYNGDRYAQTPGKAVRRDARGRVAMILPEGDRDDPQARIAPFKLHRGRLPVLKQQQWLAPLTTEELYVHGNPDQAVRDGVRHWYGLEVDADDFVWEETIRY